MTKRKSKKRVSAPDVKTKEVPKRSVLPGAETSDSRICWRFRHVDHDGPWGFEAELEGVAVRSLKVDEDDVRELFTVHLTESGGLTLPARSLSEGTLRFLALCVLLEDASVTGLLCMEEPENGIHPANLNAMVELVRDLAVDVNVPPGDDNPFRQVIINTHSPNVVQLVDPRDLLFADTARRRTPTAPSARRSSSARWPTRGGPTPRPSPR